MCNYFNDGVERFFIVFEDFSFMICKQYPTIYADIANVYNHWFQLNGGY
jgi:hypothetical protein